MFRRNRLLPVVVPLFVLSPLPLAGGRITTGAAFAGAATTLPNHASGSASAWTSSPGHAPFAVLGVNGSHLRPLVAPHQVPVNVSVGPVHFESTTAPYDPNATPLQQIATKAPVRVTTYVTYSSVPTFCTVQVTDTFTQNGQQIGMYSVYNGVCSPDNVTGEAFHGTFNFNNPGTVTVSSQVTVTITGNSPEQSTVTTSILVIGSALPTSTPTPTSTPIPSTSTRFKMLSVRGQPVNSKADWQLVRAPITQVAPKGQFELAAYYRISSAPAGSVAQFHILGTFHGSNILNATDKPYTLPSGIPYTVWHSDTITVGSNTGQETYTVQITINGVTKSASTQILLARPPSPIRAFSFALQRVQLLNDQRHPQSRFAPGSGLWVQFHIKVNHLPGHRQGEVSIVYVDPRTRKALFKPAISLLSLRNGKQTEAVHLFAPSGVGPKVGIAVGITLAGKTHSKRVNLTLG